jgi:small subunit ribosomal protein S6
MRYYEMLYFMNPDLADEEYKEAIEGFNDNVSKNKGVVIKVDEWGKRNLAYYIKGFARGYYVLLNYCGGPATTTELQRALRLDDRVLKYQAIKLSEHADPEALKKQAEEGKPEAAPESEAADETSAVAPPENEQTQKDKEEQNGL